MGTPDNKIILDLENSSNATAFGTANIIHSSEFDKINKEISIRIINAEKEKEAEIKGNERTNALDTITILGSRGSGKTSFLKSIAKHYKENKNIEVINIIDPTMIEEKGHIFLTIISQIKVKVDDKIESINRNNGDNIFCIREKWKKKLQKLSAGLPSIDGINTSMDGWQDSEYVMNKGLQGVQSAMELADNFHQLVKHALGVLEKKMFILMLDDIDIDFLKGWPVLETVRKYLTTPFITTIVSGDMRLFAKAVRKKQWSNFGKALLKNEAEKLERMSEFNNVVTEMEGQYLQKVLKPQYRIKLSTLLEKYRYNENLNVGVKFKDIENPKPLKEYYSYFLSNFGINSSYQKDCYIDFLLGLPLRTQVQFLIKSNEKEAPEEIIDVFISELHEKEIDIELARSLPKFTTSVILDTLVKNKVLGDGYQLQPTSTDFTLNSNYMAFTMLYSILIQKNKFLIFEYFVKIGYLHNLLSLLGYRCDKNAQQDTASKRKTYSPSIEDLIKHSSITKDQNTRDAMCYITAFMSAYFKSNASKITNATYVGSVVLYGLAEKSKISAKEARKRLDHAFEDKTIEQQIAYIPASMAQGDKQSTVFTYSVYVLLGAISEIIKVHYKDKGEVKKLLRQISQIKTYPMPNGAFNDETAKEELDNSEENIVTQTPEVEDKNDLEALITEWLNMADTNENRSQNAQFPKISPHLLGKISTRMYYTITSIDTSANFDNIGDTMHRWIIAIMNSILVEDIIENAKEFSNINNNNPIEKDDIFIYNLNNINKTDNKKLEFSKWMLSCPLFLLYLNYNNQSQSPPRPNEEQPPPPVTKNLYTPLSEYIDNSAYFEKIYNFSIYEKLKNVLKKEKPASSEDQKPKIKFSYNKNKIKNTIEALKENIIYDFFKSPNTTIDEIKNTLKLHFEGQITEFSIKKVRKYILDNETQP